LCPHLRIYPITHRNLSITPSDVEHVGKPPENLKSYHDDREEHSRGGGYQRGVSMQKNGEYYMHKMRKSYIYMVQRREGLLLLLLLLLEFALIIAGEGDSCGKKKESAAAELNRRGSV
jgi:hypothetical protein